MILTCSSAQNGFANCNDSNSNSIESHPILYSYCLIEIRGSARRKPTLQSVSRSICLIAIIILLRVKLAE